MNCTCPPSSDLEPMAERRQLAVPDRAEQVERCSDAAVVSFHRLDDLAELRRGAAGRG